MPRQQDPHRALTPHLNQAKTKHHVLRSEVKMTVASTFVARTKNFQVPGTSCFTESTILIMSNFHLTEVTFLELLLSETAQLHCLLLCPPGKRDRSTSSLYCGLSPMLYASFFGPSLADHVLRRETSLEAIQLSHVCHRPCECCTSSATY